MLPWGRRKKIDALQPRTRFAAEENFEGPVTRSRFTLNPQWEVDRVPVELLEDARAAKNESESIRELRRLTEAAKRPFTEADMIAIQQQREQYADEAERGCEEAEERGQDEWDFF